MVSPAVAFLAHSAPRTQEAYEPVLDRIQQLLLWEAQLHEMVLPSSTQTKNSPTIAAAPADAPQHTLLAPAPAPGPRLPTLSLAPPFYMQDTRAKPLPIQAVLNRPARPSLAPLCHQRPATKSHTPHRQQRSPLQFSFTSRVEEISEGGKAAYRPGQVPRRLRRTPFEIVSTEPLYLPTEEPTTAIPTVIHTPALAPAVATTALASETSTNDISSHRSSRRTRRRKDDARRSRLSERSIAYDEFQAAMKEAERRMLEHERLASRSIKAKIYDAVYDWAVENIAKPLGLKVD